MGSMAILEKEVLIKIDNRNFIYYKKLGYNINQYLDKSAVLRVKRGTEILVKIEDLQKCSVKVTRICDICGEHTENKAYSEIIKERENGDGKDRCLKCANIKRGIDEREHAASIKIGQINKNRFDSVMIVEEYIDSETVVVRFENGNYRVVTNWDQFIKGKVMNVYDKSMYGVGYLGDGKYKTSVNYNQTPQFKTWHGMLKRCYKDKYKEKFPTYNECIVCDEWHNFQNFAAWYDQNYYEIENERMELDKDILVKGNKIYSPDTCVFVPKKINYLFLKCDARRGDLPIGVYQHTETKKYVANCSDGNKKTINLGCYTTPEKAFSVYKIYKEKLIKQFAEHYKVKIPNNLYEAMMKYEIDITD
jgi:hypothetical protein